MIVAGKFTSITGATRNRVARFNNDNTLDTGYAPSFNNDVNVVAVQPDGRLVVGGSFTTVNTTARANLARILPDGSTDAAFAPAVGVVRQLIVQGDGRILVLAAGTGGSSVVSRFNADGSADASFTSFNGGSAAINAITLQADGKIIVGGAFTGFIRRLNANGTVDATFDPQPDGAVTAVTLQPDGRAMLAGAFARMGGLLRPGLARLTVTAPATQSFAVNAVRTGLTWTRGGPAPELSSVTIDRSDDAVTWTRVGSASRVTGSSTWQITVSPALPASGNFYVRARALAPGGGGTSSGVMEVVRELNLANVLASEVLQSSALQPADSTPPIVVVPSSTTPPKSVPVAGFRVLADTASLNAAIAAAQLATTSGSGSLPRLSNLSTRAVVAPDAALLTGFSIAGTGERTVLVRAVGPGLAGFGVNGGLTAPVLRLYDSAGNTLVENNGWAGSAAIAQAAAMGGAFPFAAGSTDAAILVTLPPGGYSIQVDANGAAAGIALAEVYDIAGGSASRLANVSSRASVSAGSGVLISGFVVAGGASDSFLVRGVGPGLVAFGVTGALADPQLGVFDSAGRTVGSNDNWSGTTVSTTAANVGAFALSAGSKDAALTTTLAPGAYTAQVSGVAGSTGGVLLEIYEVR
jgi:uncharacterized delta-60 repeat protein